MRDIIKASELLKNNSFTCVLCKGEKVLVSKERGVKPLLNWICEGVDLKDFSGADKVVGKATAFLYVLAGVKVVYAPVMSKSAVNVLKNYGVQPICDCLVEAIRNRDNTGFCPMETAVAEIDEPEKALEAIKRRLKELQKTTEN